MKRFVLFIILFFLLTLSAVWLASAGTPISIKYSKHNLSSKPESGTGPIRSVTTSGGTDEICVFCHTPHSGNTAAPLWNKTASVGSYITYTSDVLTGLGYPGAENPNTHVKTRICLSCHDGTIALGALVNLPSNLSYGTTQIPMEGTAGADVTYGMPKTAAGYIGVNLSDDHPVAIKYVTGTPDPELQSIPFDSKVRLYKDSLDNNYVECTSCHEPHDNQYGNFLVETNKNSALCERCHGKTGFSASVHADTSINASYEPPTGMAPPDDKHGPMVGNVRCMNCHFPHKAGITDVSKLPQADPNTIAKAGYYLLTFQEESSCFNNTNRWGVSVAVCHGYNAPAAKKIETLMNGGKLRFHQVGESNWAGRHTATEARQYIAGLGWSGVSLWHVECADCHNPHTAGSTLHTRGSNLVGNTSPLYGTGGVDAGTYPPWAINSTSINYSAIEAAGVTNSALSGVQHEYQICLKCHSDFAWGTNRPTPTLTNPLGYNLTNQAMEFGNNATPVSSHPVIFPNSNDQGTYVAPWSATAIPQQTMYCSDCHNNDSARSPFGAGSDAVGPHGSNNRAILKKTYDPTTIGSNSGELCFDCHNFDTYSNGAGTGTGFRTAATLNLHTRHMAPVGSGGVAYQGGVAKICAGCHVNPPHGINRQHLISYTSDQAPYGTNTKITAYTANTANYVTANCSAVTCHAGSHL